jgi:hypothetical protein
MGECFFQLGNFVVENIIQAKNSWVLNGFFSICGLKKLCLELTQSYTEETEIVLIVIIMIMLAMCSVHTHTHTHTHKKERILVVKNWQFYLHQAHEYHHQLFCEWMH